MMVVPYQGSEESNLTLTWQFGLAQAIRPFLLLHHSKM